MTTPTIYQPEFIPYYPAVAKQYGLNPVETLVYGFVRFYTTATNNKFYFSNEQIGFMVDRKKSQISAAVNKLVNVGLLNSEYQTKAKGGQIRLLGVNRLPKNRKSELGKKAGYRKLGSQTTGNSVGNNNKVNKNKNTLPAKPAVVNKNVDKYVDNSRRTRDKERGNGVVAIGELLAKYKITPAAERQHIFTPFQEHALRVAEKLNVEPDGAWFAVFKRHYAKNQAGKLDAAYSRTVDAGARGNKKYFYWAVAH